MNRNGRPHRGRQTIEWLATLAFGISTAVSGIQLATGSLGGGSWFAFILSAVAFACSLTIAILTQREDTDL